MSRAATQFSLTELSRCLILLAATSGVAEAQQSQPMSTPTETVAQASPRLPVFFVENRGQWAGEARYAGNTAGYAVAFHDDKVVLTRSNEKGSATVELAFVGARAKPQGEDPLRARVSYFVGEASTWRSNLESCAAVRYRGLWPGVDLRFYENAGALEYDVILAPGAELAPVEFEVRGATGLTVEGDGGLVLHTDIGALRQAAPGTWEVDALGLPRLVECTFEIRSNYGFGFRARRIDPLLPLVVDPVLVWGTYFGSSGTDFSSGLAVDALGGVIVGGVSATLAGTAGAYQSSPTGSNDAFLAKLDPTQVGSAQLQWLSFIGGSSYDEASQIALMQSGEIALCGKTNSVDFPTTVGAFSTVGGAYASILSSDGSNLEYSTRLQGTYTGPIADRLALATDAQGSLWIATATDTSDWPTSFGAYQPTYGGNRDLWMCRLDPELVGSAQLLWASYLGGPFVEDLGSIAVHDSLPDVVTLNGSTYSGSTLPRDFATGMISNYDWIVGQFDASASGAAQRRFVHLIGSGFNRTDFGSGVTLNASGEIFASGWFDSDNQFALRKQVLKLSSDGSSILTSLQLFEVYDQTGARDSDVHVGADGSLTIVGSTSANNLPTTPDALQSTGGGFADAWICQLDPSLSTVQYLSYFGGTQHHDFYRSGCSHLRSNELTILLEGESPNTPVQNPYQGTAAGGWELHVSRFLLPLGSATDTGLAPRDLALLDLDTDGDLDVATANEGSDDLSLRTNDGQGVLSAELLVALTAADDGPIALASCDIDADGARDDLAVVCETSSTLVLVTNPSSALPTRVSLAVAGQRPSCVAAGDLDADPRDDLIVGREGLPLSGGAGLAVVRNGGAAVELMIPAPHPTQIARVALGDLDGDGDLDLAALARSGNDAVLLFAGDGAGALVFAGSLALTSTGLASSLVLADLDGDGRNDLAAVQPALFPPAQTLRVYRRTIDGPLSPALFTLAPDLATSGTLAIDLAVGDVEGDSIPGQLARLEFAHANAGDGTVTLRHGYTGSAFSLSTSPTVGTNPVAVALGDLNGDGCDDLVVANQGSNDVTVVLSTPSPLAQNYGTSCGGPLLAAVGSPTLGNAAFAVELTGGRAFAPALFLFSSTSADLPLPPSTCHLYLGAPLSSVLRFTSTSGRAVLAISIPNLPALLGVDLYFQGAVFRSPGGALDGALDLSDALHLQAGN